MTDVGALLEDAIARAVVAIVDGDFDEAERFIRVALALALLEPAEAK